MLDRIAVLVVVVVMKLVLLAFTVLFALCFSNPGGNCPAFPLPCQGHVERSNLEWSRITLEWKGVDNKSGGTTLASAHALCLNLLSCVWLRISGGWNCCQEIRRRVVYRLIGVEMDIKDVNDFNLRTKELGCNY